MSTDPSLLTKALNLIARARGNLKKRAPYISPTLYGLIPQPVEGIETMGVTPKMVLYFDPTWLVNEPDFQLHDDRGHDIGYTVIASCLYHECCHVLRDLKRLERLSDKELANISGDIPINDDLREAGWVLPHWVAYPETYGFPKGKTLEVYYDLLKKKQQGQQQKDGSGKDKGNSSSPQPGQGPPGDGASTPGGPGSKPQHKIGGGCCGGIAGNTSRKELEDKLDGELGRHPAEVESIKRETVERIKEHQQQKGRGSTPGFKEQDLVFEKKQPQVNWRREVSRVIRKTSGRTIPGGDDFSLARPSRRSMLFGVVRPGLVQQEAEMVFIRDTSGSMSDETLNDANNEIIGAMRKLGIEEVWLLDADVRVQGKPTRVRLRDVPKLKIHGRGGTSFIPALASITKLRPKPDICVYLTDGDGSAPDKPPKGIEVIWCIVPKVGGRKPATWGHTVVCSNDRKLRQPYGC